MYKVTIEIGVTSEDLGKLKEVTSAIYGLVCNLGLFDGDSCHASETYEENGEYLDSDEWEVMP